MAVRLYGGQNRSGAVAPDARLYGRHPRPVNACAPAEQDASAKRKRLARLRHGQETIKHLAQVLLPGAANCGRGSGQVWTVPYRHNLRIKVLNTSGRVE